MKVYTNNTLTTLAALQMNETDAVDFSVEHNGVYIGDGQPMYEFTETDPDFRIKSWMGLVALAMMEPRVVGGRISESGWHITFEVDKDFVDGEGQLDGVRVTPYEYVTLDELERALKHYSDAVAEYNRLREKLRREKLRYNGNKNVSDLQREVDAAERLMYSLWNVRLTDMKSALLLTEGKFERVSFVDFRHEWTDLVMVDPHGNEFSAVLGSDSNGDTWIDVEDKSGGSTRYW